MRRLFAFSAAGTKFPGKLAHYVSSHSGSGQCRGVICAYSRGSVAHYGAEAVNNIIKKRQASRRAPHLAYSAGVIIKDRMILIRYGEGMSRGGGGR